jgi:hypothetical protein
MLNGESVVSFTKSGVLDVELRNFWPPEDGFAWSMDKWCEIAFEYDQDAISPQARGEMVLDLDVYKFPPDLLEQSVYIYLNGLRIGARRISKRATVFIDFAPGVLAATNTLVIDTPEASSPARFGQNDERVLGIQLFTLQVRQIAPIAAF